MPNNQNNLAHRIHQFLNQNNYDEYYAEAQGYLGLVAAYLIVKWEREFAKRGFPGPITSPDETDPPLLLTEDEDVIITESGDFIRV